MKIEDIKLKDAEKGTIFYYLDDKNNEIKKLRLKQHVIKEDSGYFLISGKIKIVDGTIYPAILGVSSDDGGELFEAYFYVNNNYISQNKKSFLKQIKKKKNEIFPYKYHLDIKVEGDKNMEQQF